MAMTFIVPGTDVYQETGFQPIFPGFSARTPLAPATCAQILGRTSDAAHFVGQYDFKEFRYGEVLLNLAEALFERTGSSPMPIWTGRSASCAAGLPCQP